MKRISAFVLIGWCAVVFLSGCSSPQMNRIDRNREVYETWPIETRQAVLDGKVEQGMTPDMVRVSWGEPTKVEEPNPGEEIWIYETGGSEGSAIDPGFPAAGNAGLIAGSSGRPIGGVGIGTGGIMQPAATIGGGPGMGGTPIYIPPTPPEVREVVFHDSVVVRADRP